MNFKDYIRAGKGAADITPLLLDPDAFHSSINALAEQFIEIHIDKIACTEARGFILGSALAYKLHVGLIPLRKPGGLKNEVYSVMYKDYSQQEKTLEMHKDAIQPNEKIVIIDDWVETGGVLKAAIALIEKAQGTIVGIGSLIDDSEESLKDYLKKYNYHFLIEVTPEDSF